MKNYVIIIDGIDNVGKSTTIKTIKSFIPTMKLMNGRDEDFDAFRAPMKDFNKNANVSLINDVISLSNLQIYLKQIFDTCKNNEDQSNYFVFDRLLVAPYVYGNVMRNREFNEIWANDSYIDYANAFITSLKNANIEIIHIVALRKKGFKFEDDMKNYLVKAFDWQLELANKSFEKHAEKFNATKVYIDKEDFDKLFEVVIEKIQNDQYANYIENKQKINQAKAYAKSYTDFYGGKLNVEALDNAIDKNDLLKIIFEHEDFLTAMDSDAKSHLFRFKQQLVKKLN